MPAVQMLNISKSFGQFKALDQVSFTLEQGSILGLLGENGAGKSTLMNILFGLYQADEGQISLHNQAVHLKSPAQAMQLGLGMVHQHFMLVKPMSVLENIMLGLPHKGMLLPRAAVRARIVELSQRYDLKVDPDACIWQLSVGEQQRVEILSSMFLGADILIMDEPTAVLTPQESQELFNIFRLMQAENKSIILISHKLEEILAIADTVTVLRLGQLVGSMAVLPNTSKDELTQMMVGRQVQFAINTNHALQGEVKLEVANICAKNDRNLQALHNLNFEIKAGEILGLAGVDGNGQQELCEVLTGLRQPLSGEVRIKGHNVAGKSPWEFIREGVAHIPGDRQRLGMAMNWSLADNLLAKYFKKPQALQHGLLNFKKYYELMTQYIQNFKIKANASSDLAKELSGGNQQKVVLAREFGLDPEILIINQPTRGLDVGAMEFIRKQILERKAAGSAILLISADLEEIYQLSDRIAVIYEGRIMKILPPTATQQEVGLLMAGVQDAA